VKARKGSEDAPDTDEIAVRERLGSIARPAVPALAVLVLLVVVGWLVALSSSASPTNAAHSGIVVPVVIGLPLGQAQAVMRKAGLEGVADERDPQGPDSVVVAQEPAGGITVPLGSTVGFRTTGPDRIRSA
jgi:beta-lactam-binding protein with PASTA domain